VNTDCIYFDECESRNLSICCTASIILHDICSDCKEHTEPSGCDECPEYVTEDDDLQNRKDNEAERIYQANKEER
jgi:hypothetical protein